MLLAQLTTALAASAPASAMLLGSGRQPAASAAEGDFSGVGRIECMDRRRHGTHEMGTAWVAGAADTIVTAAHILFRTPSAELSRGDTLDPAHCTFSLRDRDGKVRETVRVRYALSPWSDERFRHDSSYDVAILKLERPVKIRAVPVVTVSRAIYTRSIRLAAFQSGVGDDDRLWLTAGHAASLHASFGGDYGQGIRISKTSRLFATSADSTPGSSGGMYYDPVRKAVVGIHVGSLCGYAQARFDPDSCFNYGLRFDAGMVRMIDSVAADTPLEEAIVRPSLDAAAMRMAMLAPRLP